MAFKILNDVELSLLGDSERIQYEKELELYQQRITLIEHLELLENANIEPFIPQVKSIYIIDKLDIKSFKKTEYDLSMCEPLVTPDLYVKEFKKIEPQTPVMPLMPKPAAIQTKYVHKSIVVQPDLPITAKPKVVEISFKRTKTKQLNLPTIVSPSITNSISFEKVKDTLHPTLNDIPHVVIPAVDMVPFVAPVKSQLNLPKISANIVKARTFMKPEQNSIEMQTVVKPEINVPHYRRMQSAQLSLPHITVAAPLVKAQFQKPKQLNKPLPKVVKLESVTTPFIMPKRKKLELPHITSINFTAKSFGKVKIARPVMDMPILPSAPAITFVMTKASVSNLPKISTVNVPDAKSVLRELLPASGEAQKT